MQTSISAALRTTLLAALTGASIAALTLSSAAQATRTGSTPPPEPSRVDLYAGYAYFHPVDSDINEIKYPPITAGGIASITGYFNRYLGLQAEGSFFPHGPTDNECVFTAQAGPVLRYPKGRLVPFVHVLGGGAMVGGPYYQPCTWGWGITGGTGLAYRLSAVLVLRLGQVAIPPPVQLGFTAQPANAFAGDPVTVTAIPANLDPKKKASYTWTATGGQIAGSDTTATVNTAGLAPGDYTVTGHVSEGVRPSLQATCTAGFRIHAYEPPTLTCSANPSSLMPGDTATITSGGHSPQNRPLSYSYSASSGQITGTTGTATLNTSGATPGTIIVTCNVVDDLGKQATATTSVTITAPPPPPAPQPSSLCSVSFERDRKRPVRVDNEAKGCLDEIALTLNRD